METKQFDDQLKTQIALICQDIKSKIRTAFSDREIELLFNNDGTEFVDIAMSQLPQEIIQFDRLQKNKLKLRILSIIHTRADAYDMLLAAFRDLK